MYVVACIEPHLRCLRIVGFCRISEEGTGSRKWRLMHDIYRTFVLSVTSIYLLQECIYAYQMRSNMEELARVMFLLLCHVTSLAKQVVFAIQPARVEALVAALGNAAAVQDTEGKAAVLVEKTRRHAAYLQAVFASTAMFTCTLWLVFPLAARLQQRQVTFPFWLPGDAHAPLRFTIALIYQFYVTSLVGIANTTMDAFIATVLYQCQTQLRILRLQFENLIGNAEKTSVNTKQDHIQASMRHFIGCVDHYHRIIETANMLQDIFGLAILINFAVGGWILCMAVYKLVSVSILSIEFLSVLLFISCILFELFLYCYYGNEVTVESGMLVESVYSCGWEGPGRRHLARGALLTILRACRPLKPSASKLVPLSLETFIKILKSSYTFYAVLRQTKDKI